VFLGNGQDYLKGFGSGIFNGGNGQDALKLTSGSYTVGRSGTTVNFTKGSTVMNTSEFEILIAGNTIYNFASLTESQTIFVA
jgi:archaellum component FlaF (FlaF/FlaG flagellin family)